MPEDRPRPDATPRSSPATPSDLITRAVSGAVLAAVAVALLYAGSPPFAAFVLIVTLAMSWEWTRIVRQSNFDIGLLVHGVAVAAAVGLAALGYAALGVAALCTGAVLAGVLTIAHHPMLSSAGVLYAGLPAVCLLWLREDEPNGFLAALFVLIAVVATDTAAYICGRSIGGPRLAPKISPNKTWSGLVGGVAASAVVSAVFAHYAGAPMLKLVLAGATLGAMSQAGDLTESALKRAFGIKDASALIPGHGGVMDRVDGFVFAAVAAALMALMINPQAPATALLYGH